MARFVVDKPSSCRSRGSKVHLYDVVEANLIGGEQCLICGFDRETEISSESTGCAVGLSFASPRGNIYWQRTIPYRNQPLVHRILYLSLLICNDVWSRADWVPSLALLKSQASHLSRHVSRDVAQGYPRFHLCLRLPCSGPAHPERLQGFVL